MVALQKDSLTVLANGTHIYELTADTETPVSAYLKLSTQGPSFLLESVTGGEHLGRYSFIGLLPKRIWTLSPAKWECYQQGNRLHLPLTASEDPLTVIRPYLQVANQGDSPPNPGWPRFTGGLAGYLGFETVRYFEPTLKLTPDPLLPEALLLEPSVLLAFDHAYNKIVLMAHPIDGNEAETQDRLSDVISRLHRPIPPSASFTSAAPGTAELRSTFSQPRFLAAVAQVKEAIAAGEIFQAVLSQRLVRPAYAPPFAIYRALRRLNPSPYMFYFDFGEVGGAPFYLIGASPEMHVRLEGKRAMMRPIAGTRPRGADARQDALNESELLADPKERAEHLMLVDLARNDLGRVCDYGSVEVTERMVVERYSHVMHIVSQVEGHLQKELHALDLLRASFPAGTVSGAPKIRAIQIIQELEPHPRGPYAGVTGYLGLDGNMDTCITIRTLVYHGDHLAVQAGAGIVADSQPEREYEETLNKARALLKAVDMAEAHAHG